MKSYLIIALLTALTLFVVVPVYILQRRLTFFQQIYDSNRFGDYHCMLDVTTLQEKIDVDFDLSKRRYETLTSQLNNTVQTRETHAQFVPHECVPSETIAIIIPIRDRDEHLHILLGHLHPILQKQLLRLVRDVSDIILA